MKLRIVKDKYAGYEVQEWKWYCPFWVQCNFTNTHASVEAAEEWAEAYIRNFVVKEWSI